MFRIYIFSGLFFYLILWLMQTLPVGSLAQLQETQQNFAPNSVKYQIQMMPTPV